jgi:uncharacterized protein YqgQ
MQLFQNKVLEKDGEDHVRNEEVLRRVKEEEYPTNSKKGRLTG